MIHHSAIVDQFLEQPDSIRKVIIETPMKNHLASDGVTYPGIVELDEPTQWYLAQRFRELYSDRFRAKLMFARHSYETMPPPNWAHSDLNMAQYVGLTYLSPVDYPWDGTHCVRHKKSKISIHPKNQDEIDLVMGDSNNKDKWDIIYTCPSQYNRLFVLNARHLHAAAYKFGTNRTNSRLVLSVFFDLV